MRLLAERERRHAAGVQDDEGAGGLDALKAGMGRVRDRRAAGVVIGEDGGQLVPRRRTHAVEQSEMPVAMPEEAQHRHHAVDRVEQRRRRRNVARGEYLAQREEIDQ